MTLKYTLLLWQISVHSVFSRYLDSRFFSILGWMADVRKGGKHVKIGENSVLIFQKCRAFSNTLTWPSNTTPPPPQEKKKQTNKNKKNKTKTKQKNKKKSKNKKQKTKTNKKKKHEKS